MSYYATLNAYPPVYNPFNPPHDAHVSCATSRLHDAHVRAFDYAAYQEALADELPTWEQELAEWGLDDEGYDVTTPF
ncbi:hypothetical protein [Moraxella marmotae]|uniref:hypothetical protein n=1 Tax=Moraxella marmotae TaxID=3344520 RepID=UPI0035F22F48